MAPRTFSQPLFDRPLCLMVRDSGHGMDAATVSRIRALHDNALKEVVAKRTIEAALGLRLPL